MTSNLQSFLSRLGLTAEEARLYETLVNKGTLTILELSRASGIPRTQVYRIVQSLKEKGLVEEIVDEFRRMVKASDVAQIEQIVGERKRETKELEALFPAMRQELFATLGKDQPETKVQFYRGRAGLRQMVWHTLRAKKEVVGYTYRPIEEYVGIEFLRDWKQAFERKQLKFRDIYSDEYKKAFAEGKDRLAYNSDTFRGRFISESILKVNIQMDIYNDVVAQYNWHEGEVFGVEIYNAKVAGFHKQLFELVWKLAKPIKT